MIKFGKSLFCIWSSPNEFRSQKEENKDPNMLKQLAPRTQNMHNKGFHPTKSTCIHFNKIIRDNMQLYGWDLSIHSIQVPKEEPPYQNGSLKERIKRIGDKDERLMLARMVSNSFFLLPPSASLFPSLSFFFSSLLGLV